jgi:hypothetical protein
MCKKGGSLEVSIKEILTRLYHLDSYEMKDLAALLGLSETQEEVKED